ncbi:MAG: serine/threonine-protein kinase, partial [Planctomycetota bacterium]|nr:serine/threonine-protein kinase [Planctomycetota bacterium]
MADHIGQYRLLRKLGEAGLGAVYLAEDPVARRNVALQVLPRKLHSDPHFMMRFEREARAASSLNHVNIVATYTVGEDAGQHFLVTEYCEGETLDKLLKRTQFLPWDQALGIVTQAARGLKHGHENDILCRELRPASIIVTAGGVAKILGMGVPKAEPSGAPTGAAAAHYLSTEQARCDNEIDGRTDVYSLGATFYHMLTGEPPFAGPSAEAIAAKRLSEQLPNPQDLRDGIPDGVVQVLQKMMAREPADRYRDCGELLDDLEL